MRTLKLLFICLALAGSNVWATSPTTEEIFASLKEGNARYREGASLYGNLTPQRRQEVAKGQAPLVTVLSCSDSRVPPELIFDKGLGELFVIRVAGNVADTDEIGTIEYGVGHLHTPVLLVMGHSGCGAVKAVVEEAQVHGSIPQLVDNIAPAVFRARAGGVEGAQLVSDAVRHNVWVAVEDIFRKSEEVRHLVLEKKLVVQGAVYDLESGEVAWLGGHPKEAELLQGPKTAPGVTKSKGAAH